MSADFDYRVVSSRKRFTGRMFQVYSDVVEMPDGGTAARDRLHHPGSVAVVAIDERHRVVMLRQFRHPARRFLWEVPAGLTDVPGESPQDAAARELAEEVDLAAAVWRPLLEIFASPGTSDELVRIYLAERLSPVPLAQRHVRAREESAMEVRRVPLEDAMQMVLSGAVANGVAAAGILAAAALLNSPKAG